MTGYRSRNTQGYELNIDGKPVNLENIDVDLLVCCDCLIEKFTPFEKQGIADPKKVELEKIVSDLNEQLNNAKKKLESL